jgi:hypothetical protein
MDMNIYISATGKYVLYTHQHKTALPQTVVSNLRTEVPFIGERIKSI